MITQVESELLILRKVTPADLPAAAEYRAEFLTSGDSMDGCSNLRRFEDMNDWYDWIRKAEHWETCPEGWIPDSQFISILKSDGSLVGMLDIRHVLNDACRNLFGNIGYSIRPSARQKGYASEQLRLALQICKSLDMDRVLVTCHKENTASAKTIRKKRRRS